MSDETENALQTRLTFGRHKGRTLGEIDTSYLSWLAGERRVEGDAQGFRVKIPAKLQEAAKVALASARAQAEAQDRLKKALRGQPDSHGGTLYVVERLGDLERDRSMGPLSCEVSR